MKKSGLLLSILLLAFLVRLVLLNQSFWLDEAAQALESIRPFSQQLQIGYDFQPPLYHVLVHFLTKVSLKEWWLRSLSLLAGVGTVYLTYLIGIETGGNKKKGVAIGLLASLFLSLSVIHIFYSQELRPYALAAWWGALSWYALLKRKQNKTTWLVFVGSSLAGIYTMYVYPFLLFSQAMYVFFHAKSVWKTMLKSLAIIVLFSLPLAPLFFNQLQIGTQLRIQLPGWEQVVSLPQWKALPLVGVKFLSGLDRVSFSTVLSSIYATGPLILVGALGVWFFLKKKTATPITPYLYWFGVSILAAWLVSFVVPVIQPKRVLFALPAVYLLIAYMAMELPVHYKKTFVVLFILLQMWMIGSYWTKPANHREDWRGVVATLHAQFPTDSTIIVFGSYEPLAPWTWYERTESLKFRTLSIASIRSVTPQDIEKNMPTVLPYTHVLVLDYLRDLTDPSRGIERWLESHGYKGVASLDTTNIGFIRQYEKQQFLSSGRD